MTSADLHQRLSQLQDDLAALAREHRALCDRVPPDFVELGRVRWRIAQIGRHRMDLLSGDVFPFLRDRCAAADACAVEALRKEGCLYRAEVSRYVARWPTRAIAAEWTVYLAEAREFRKRVAAQIGKERRILLPLLRQV